MECYRGQWSDEDLKPWLRPFKSEPGMSWTNNEDTHWLFLKLNGNPVAVSSLMARGTESRLKSAVVLAMYRRFGLYRGMVGLRQQQALELGAINCTTFAGPMSIGHLKAVGFVPMGDKNSAGSILLRKVLTPENCVV